MVNRSEFITPPSESEETYPYWQVWRSLTILVGILFVLTLILQVVPSLAPGPGRQIVGLVLAILPLMLWLALLWIPEFFVPQPRQQLLPVCVVSALAASAVGVPLVSRILQADQWLPLGDLIERIIGYAFTYGLTAEFIKYVVILTIAWPIHYRHRYDGIAYGIASAVGYATVLNINFILENGPTLAVASVQILDVAFMQFIGSLIVAYGLVESRFSQPSPFLLVGMMGSALLIVSVITTLRTNLINPRLTLDVTAMRVPLGIVLSLVSFAAIAFVIGFLFRVAENS